jgi:poly-gamma-glutamate capsule biosynthesis protein CapA/YwtB (metallophosphatase superfamily)
MKAAAGIGRAGLTLLAALALVSGAAAQPPRDPLSVTPVPVTPMPDGFTLAAVGDVIYLRPMLATIEKRSPDMLKILRGADVTFGNFETTAVDLRTFKGSPQAESGGTWMLADPRSVADLKAMGFDLVGRANNHTTDWGVEGMVETGEWLDAAGLVQAGVGRNLSTARTPAYVDVGAGRVGLVSASSSFTPMSRASDALGEAPGRAGLNALRTRRIGLVSEADLAVLARLAGAKTPFGIVRFNGAEYRADPKATGEATYSYELNSADAAANLLAVRQARQNANLALLSVHAHEPGNFSETPADYLQGFARQAIDQGADAVIGHGPHQLRGIEIYKGRPIFYSLGNFAMMTNSLDVVPADMFEQYGVAPGAATTPELLQARNAREYGDRRLMESVIAVSRYVGGEVAEIRFYPLDLGVTAAGAERGVPKLADAAVGRVILERLQRLSAPYGTNIVIQGGVGVWRRADVAKLASNTPKQRSH